MPKFVIVLEPDVDLFFVGFCAPLYADIAAWSNDPDRAARDSSLSFSESQCDYLRSLGFRNAVVRCLDG